MLKSVFRKATSAHVLSRGTCDLGSYRSSFVAVSHGDTPECRRFRVLLCTVFSPAFSATAFRGLPAARGLTAPGATEGKPCLAAPGNQLCHGR